ncbi:MAG: class I mannose-6-phosphate isomerase [Butyrivibrio sp.]|nr:class I mannose-6-phosphate isomerase [Muribaculum sp.]MCM1553376.1 class I mannose-6-phosphate isomerase [Butyrivibrio sp.]
MTSKNMSLQNKPFLLAPVGKDYLWGGNRLKTDFHKNIDLTPLAETWECSTHPDGSSIVASGRHQGMPLDQVIARHPEYLGSHPVTVMGGSSPDSQAKPCELPVLVKLIDAAQSLSVQVHPDDAFAKAHENGSLGKTEMWYVLDAKPNAHLIYGFNRNMNKELLLNSLAHGTIEKYLQKVPVQRDDMFFIEAGTVHAIGAGVLLAEVQENSNLTYRLFDYDRRDKNGQKRPLHIENAMQVLNYKSSNAPRQPIRVLRYRPGYASELLCSCKYFQVERLLINTVSTNAPDCSTTEHSFQILLCLEGEGALLTETGDLESGEGATPVTTLDLESREDATHVTTLPFTKGSCVFLPADSAPTRIQGKATLLRISC